MGASDEIPPHDYLLGERLTSEQNQLGPFLRSERKICPSRWDVMQATVVYNISIDGCLTGYDKEPIFKGFIRRHFSSRPSRDVYLYTN